MRYMLVRVLLAYGVGSLVFLSAGLLAAGLLAAGPASASSPVSVGGTVVETAQTGTSVPATSPSPDATTDTPTPSPGPADPGTGETGEAKDTRTDFAPAYIAAIAVVVAVVVLVLWRRRGKKTIV
jgi:cobalamin biosynthesis Mg chelatase CobN